MNCAISFINFCSGPKRVLFYMAIFYSNLVCQCYHTKCLQLYCLQQVVEWQNAFLSLYHKIILYRYNLHRYIYILQTFSFHIWRVTTKWNFSRLAFFHSITSNYYNLWVILISFHTVKNPSWKFRNIFMKARTLSSIFLNFSILSYWFLNIHLYTGFGSKLPHTFFLQCNQNI
jgi:hypothetical protein